MSRSIAILLLLLLAACQTPKGASNAGDSSTEAQDFNHDTVQTYDIQSGQYQQQPPFGTRGNRAQ